MPVYSDEPLRITRTTRKPFRTVVKRRPKAERAKVQPLFWLEPHWNRDMKYVVLYVPRRVIVLGWSVLRQPLRHVA